jgi:galacturan 1,4-alpha-galacturonidase
MQLTLLPILLALSSLPAILANAPSRTIQNVGRASCTLAPLGAGKDDSPQFLTAMQACSTVVVPATSTLNISTRLNMTGLTNKHLVRPSACAPLTCIDLITFYRTEPARDTAL